MLDAGGAAAVLESRSKEVTVIDIPKDLKPGKSFKIYYGEGNVNNRVIHIRAIVDDEMVVFRQWSRAKQRWIYTIEHLYYFELINTGVLQVR